MRIMNKYVDFLSFRHLVTNERYCTFYHAGTFCYNLMLCYLFDVPSICDRHPISGSNDWDEDELLQADTVDCGRSCLWYYGTQQTSVQRQSFHIQEALPADNYSRSLLLCGSWWSTNTVVLWAEALGEKVYRKCLSQLQKRGSLMRITRNNRLNHNWGRREESYIPQ